MSKETAFCDDSERRKRETEFDARIREKQRELCGSRYEGVSISHVSNDPENIAKIAKWMKGRKNFLVYCGNPGIGKTFLCAGFIEWGMKEFRSFRYYNERQIFTKLREAIDKGWDCNAELRRLLDDDLVILDDVGSTGVNEWRSDILFDIVDFRYNLMLPTVFTSNFCYKEFREKYHPRLTSRLFAKENTIIQIESGVDFRQQ